ncbi:alpha/beta hydrolase, partial [Phycicoccus jejuensis]|uniref:alpha/beta hydrolase n=1 Tax=Phycicoccus jejuensis TaxID=367299 RepID=UPI000689960A
LSAVPVRRPPALGVATWAVTDLVNESPPFALGYLLLASIPPLLDDHGRTSALPWLAVGGTSMLLSPILLRRASLARGVLQTALRDTLGPVPAGIQDGWRRHLPWVRIVIAPLPILPAGVRCRRGQRYGPHRRHRLDIYSNRQIRSGRRPVLIHLHGGGFRSGRKSLYARPMLHAFARHGWLCISASYRLRPASYADMLADAHTVVAWVKQHADDLGADPEVVILAGSSAGAHLAVTAALTPRTTSGADTTVAAAIGLYGYYGPVDRTGNNPSRPAAYAHPGAPPIMLVHGAQDTLVPAGLQTDLVARLRSISRNPVVYAELPGAQHTFDLLHSLRFELVIEALWDFAGWVRARARPTLSDPTSSMAESQKDS